MPVNDSTNSTNAAANCALCTVAGLFGMTYQELLKCFGVTDDKLVSGSGSKAAELLAILYAQKHNITLTDKNRLECQINGIKYILQQMGAKDFQNHGTLANPLTVSTAIEAMKLEEEGTRFVVLVGETVLNTPFAASTHWLGAKKQATSPAVQFVDYQTDVTEPIELKLRKRLGYEVVLGKPLVGDKPTKPWGEPVSDAEDRMLVIAFRPPA